MTAFFRDSDYKGVRNEEPERFNIRSIFEGCGGWIITRKWGSRLVNVKVVWIDLFEGRKITHCAECGWRKRIGFSFKE